jgi:hypothetical protein
MPSPRRFAALVDRGTSGILDREGRQRPAAHVVDPGRIVVAEPNLADSTTGFAWGEGTTRAHWMFIRISAVALSRFSLSAGRSRAATFCGQELLRSRRGQGWCPRW